MTWKTVSTTKTRKTITLLLTNSNSCIFTIDDIDCIIRNRLVGTEFLDDIFFFDIVLVITICGIFRYRCLARYKALTNWITGKLQNESVQQSKNKPFESVNIQKDDIRNNNNNNTPSHLKVVCDNILIFTVRSSTLLALFEGQLIIKVNKNTEICPAIIAFQILHYSVLIREVLDAFTHTAVSLRVILYEE
jgi:hypothetical protein